jgi:ligand-binding sensor protein
MVLKFRLSEMEALLKDFYTLTRIRITVFDTSFRELTSYPKDIAPFCHIIRTDPEGAAQCHACDKTAFDRASKRRLPYIYQCHAGLTEAITPLHTENILIGYIMFGHVFAYPSYEEGWGVISQLCQMYHVDLPRLEESIRKQPILDKEYILSASHILEAIAAFLIFKRLATLKQEELHVQVDEYIAAHYTDKNFNVNSICAHFKIGKTYLYKSARENYGVGLAEYIRNLRIEKAKNLLIGHTDMNIADVAFECGFDDYNYFISLFKKKTGLPPRKFKQNMR